MNIQEPKIRALIQGASTVFDLSGDGVVFPEFEIQTDSDSLRSDFEAIGSDFTTVMEFDSCDE